MQFDSKIKIGDVGTVCHKGNDENQFIIYNIITLVSTILDTPESFEYRFYNKGTEFSTLPIKRTETGPKAICYNFWLLLRNSHVT